MKVLTVVGLWTLMAFAFLGGFGSGTFLAQESSGAGQSAEKLPPDVHPETLSRMARARRGDLATEDEKQAFDRVLALSPTSNEWNVPGGWLGPAGIRMQIPELAEIYLKQIQTLHMKCGLEPKYQELAILVGTRESNNKSEFLDHESRDITRKLLTPKVLEIIKKEQDTKGSDEKQALIIQFGRELFHQPKVSSKTFAEMERNFGRKGTLGISLLMCYYSSNGLLMRVYDTQLYRKLGEKPPSSPW
jgi:hypothetical protein